MVRVPEATGEAWFVWPLPADANVVITRAQLDLLLEGIDWRMGPGACDQSFEKIVRAFVRIEVWKLTKLGPRRMITI